MDKTLKQLTKILEEALQSNPACTSNILLPRRVFHRNSCSGDEMIVSLNNKTLTPHYLGHIFKLGERYISLILAFDFWLNAKTEEALFSLFWDNLKVRGQWYPVGGHVFDTSDSFEEACLKLSNMIEVFDPEKALENFDMRIVQVYPFPNPFQYDIHY
jgi:hypothetical protein